MSTAPFVAATNYSTYSTPQPHPQPSARQYIGNYLLNQPRQAVLVGCHEQKYIHGGLYNISFDAARRLSGYDASTVVPAKQPQPTSNYSNIFYPDEGSEEYEHIMNEIMDCVERDMQAEYDNTCPAFYSVGNKSPTPLPSVPVEGNPTLVDSASTSRMSTSPSPTPALTPAPTPNKPAYHDIYLKPIMERIAKCVPSEQVSEAVVMRIVSKALSMGVKRQISKRTFSFMVMIAGRTYTVVMSKSLKTILDVSVAPEGKEGNGEVVTVHPDVVSILAKKCPLLDYFKIQEIAGKAKVSGVFEEKKQAYRKQFIYEFEGYRIVFASNHSTIVEMQCIRGGTAVSV